MCGRVLTGQRPWIPLQPEVQASEPPDPGTGLCTPSYSSITDNYGYHSPNYKFGWLVCCFSLNNRSLLSYLSSVSYCDYWFSKVLNHNIIFHYLFIYFYMYGCFAHMYVYVPCECDRCLRRQKMTSNPPRLELQTNVSCQGAKNPTQAL